MALKWLISKTKRFLPIMAVISFANAIYAIFSVVFALLSKGIIDAAIIRDRAQLTQYAVGMFVAILLAFIIRIFSNGSTEWMRARLEIQFRNQLLASMLQKEFTEVGKYHSGERMNRMMNDIQIVCEGVTTIVPSLVMLSTKGICAIIVLFILSPRFTIVFFVSGVIMIAVTAVLRGRMKALHKEVQEKGGVVRSFLQESLESILFVKVFSAQKKILYKAGNLQEDYFHAQMKRRTCSILAGAGVGIAFELAYLCALIMGAGGLFAETMTYGTLTAILQLVGQVQQPFVNLSGILPKYYSMLASAERVIEFEELPEELCIEKQNEVISFSKIVVRDLAFSYGRNTILKDMNLTLHKGDFLSITGRSGEGKSTLFLLLLGAYQPSKGSLFLKQNNGEQIPIDASTRCKFTYVPEENH